MLQVLNQFILFAQQETIIAIIDLTNNTNYYFVIANVQTNNAGISYYLFKFLLFFLDYLLSITKNLLLILSNLTIRMNKDLNFSFDYYLNLSIFL